MTKIKPQENISKLPGSWVSVVCVDYPGCRRSKVNSGMHKIPSSPQGMAEGGRGWAKKDAKNCHSSLNSPLEI